MDVVKTKADAAVAPNIDQLANDLSRLKTDFGKLMGDLKAESVGAARQVRRQGSGAAAEAVRRIGDEVSDAYDTVAARGDRSAKAMGRYVGEQPLVSMLIAAAIGLVAGRLLSR